MAVMATGAIAFRSDERRFSETIADGFGSVRVACHNHTQSVTWI